MPMRMRSKTLNGRGARAAVISPAMSAAGEASSRAVEMREVSGTTAERPGVEGPV